MMPLIRTFYAIEIQGDLQKLAVQIIDFLKTQNNSDIKWVKPNKLHITLHFLGSIPEEKIYASLAQVEQSLKNYQSFPLHCNSVIAFPPLHPRVVALIVKLDLPLAHLFHQTQQTLINSGFALENRPFAPHITIGRLHNYSQPKLPTLPFAINTELLVNRITLFRSDFVETETVYTPIKHIPLIQNN